MFGLAPTDYGPFAPVVGYAGAISAAGAALLYMFAGKLEKWRPPDENLPGAAQAFVLLLCGVGMVLEWFFADPQTIGQYLAAVTIFAGAGVLCFLYHIGLLEKYIFKKKIATSTSETKEVRILGGRDLLPEAEMKRRELNVDVQTFYEGVAYKKDRVWSREARVWVKQRVLLSYILTLVLGTSALTGASFAVQVLLTKQAAASVIKIKDAPGLEENKEKAAPVH